MYRGHITRKDITPIRRRLLTHNGAAGGRMHPAAVPWSEKSDQGIIFPQDPSQCDLERYRASRPAAPTRPAPTRGKEPRSPTRPTPTDPTSVRVPLTPDHGPRQTNIGSRSRGPRQGRNSRPPTGNKRNSTQLDVLIHLRG